jgi:5-methyltetrahydropteroyltriglutamate--homocysteine methyltransferase
MSPNREHSTDGRDRFRPPDHDNEHFLLTTVVGSYPKPKWVDRTRELYESDRTEAEDPRLHVDEDAWQEAKDDAARLILGEHERAGIDVIADGEMRRNEMIEYFMHRIEGAAFPGRVKVWGHNYFDKPAVTDEVAYDEEWLVSEYEFSRSVADHPVKVPITGPYTLARFSFDEVYEDTEELTYELADLVRQEVENLVDAGANYIQIDEPALAQVPGDHAIVGESLEVITENVPEDVRVGLHVCYGDYSRIYPEVLEFPIDEFDLELANGDFGQLDVFKNPAFTKDFAMGVVDAHDADVESVAEIKANIRKALEVVPPERLTVSPDCGVKLLPREIAYRKMENMATAAREVEAELDAGEIEVGAATADD